MKAVFVLDMPNDCDECPLNSHTDYDFDVCWVTQGKGGCPLRPLPQQMTWGHTSEYIDGYNACLEEILGEDNG